MDSRSIPTFVGGACVALLVSLTVSAGESGKAEGQQGPKPFDVVVVNDETAPVTVQGVVAKLPPTRFQELLGASNSGGGGEVCDEIEPIDGKRKIVEQLAIEATVPTGHAGPGVHLRATQFTPSGGSAVRFELDLVKRADDMGPSTDIWGGRFEGPLLVFAGNPANGLALCARSGAEARGFAIGTIEDLPVPD